MSFFDSDEGQNVSKRFKSSDDTEEDDSSAKLPLLEVTRKTLTASCGVADRPLGHQTLRRDDVSDSGRPQYKPLSDMQGLSRRADDRKSSLSSKPPLTPHGIVRTVSFAPTVLSSVGQMNIHRVKTSSGTAPPRRLNNDLSAGLQHSSMLAPPVTDAVSTSGIRGSSSGFNIDRGSGELSDVGFSRLVTTGNVTKSTNFASSGSSCSSGNVGGSYNAHKGSSSNNSNSNNNNNNNNNPHMPPPLSRRSHLAPSKDLQGVDSSVQLAIGLADKLKASLFSDYECLNATVAREKEGIVSACGELFRNDALVSVAKPLMLLFLRLEKVQEALVDQSRIAGAEGGEA